MLRTRGLEMTIHVIHVLIFAGLIVVAFLAGMLYERISQGGSV
jgi:hypothetical protein